MAVKWAEKIGERELENRKQLMKLRAKEAKKKLPPPPPPSDKAGLSLLRAPRITGAVPPNPFRREQPPSMVSDKVTAPFNPQLSEQIRKQQTDTVYPPLPEQGVSPTQDLGIAFRRLTGRVNKAENEALKQAYQSQVESEQSAQAISRNELFRNNPNAVIRFANTPTAIFGLTPGDIA